MVLDGDIEGSGQSGVAIGGEQSAEEGYKLEVNGTALVDGLEMRTGAGEGKILTSDASGDASWQDSPLADFTARYMPGPMEIGTDWTVFPSDGLTMTIPGQGYVTVEANVWVNMGHSAGTDDIMHVGITSDSTGWVSPGIIQRFEIKAAEPSDDTNLLSTLVTRTHVAQYPGSVTFYVTGQMVSGQSSSDYFEQVYIRALYHPAKTASVRASAAMEDAAQRAAQER